MIENCIVDFFCPQKALIVEVDGDTHDATRDASRDRANQQRGYTTVRYSNSEISGNLDGVVKDLLAKLNGLPDRWPHPNPSPEGEGL